MRNYGASIAVTQDRRSPAAGDLGTTMPKQLTLSAVIRCVLKPHHSLLRKEMERAAELTSSVVVEQRPPLCRILLPLYRLFSEFRDDLEDHLDSQDGQLFPRLMELEVALRDAHRPVASTEDVSEILRLLKYGQIGLTRLLDEMRELTHGFIAPPDACECYGELLDVLAGLQMEVASEVRMEGSMLFPQAHDLVERVRHSTAHALTATMVM
jgi:iron-sulfur cluster repair protein YtfE (RIC family)